MEVSAVCGAAAVSLALGPLDHWTIGRWLWDGIDQPLSFECWMIGASWTEAKSYGLAFTLALDIALAQLL